MLRKNIFVFSLNLIRSIIMYISWIIFQPLFMLLAYPLTFLPTSIRYDNRVYFFITGWMARFFIWPTFLKFHFTGLENLPSYPAQPAIIIANHTSAIDIAIIDMLLNTYPHVWMVKESYGKMPIFGRLVRAMHIIVHRESPRKAVQALINAITRVQGHTRHLVIFPEGTRQASGKLSEFKEGFAITAEKLRRPIIPIALAGLHEAFPKGRIVCHSFKHQISVHIGKPFFMDEGESRQEFINRIHAWYEQTLDKSGLSE